MSIQPILRAVVCAALVALRLGAGSGKTVAASDAPRADAMRYRSGVRNAPGKRRLNAAQRQQVLQSLREKTGWQSLAFDEAGFLVCPEPQVINGGSAAARRLLGAALNGAEVYELENHNASLAINFARLTAGVTYRFFNSDAAISESSLQLDFADFTFLRGDELACRAFDVGVAILHELAHGVWHLRDAESDGAEPGACENYINRIRRELRLPERQTYQARVRLGTLEPNPLTRVIAELSFVSGRNTVKPQLYSLRWDAESVGPIIPVNQAALASAMANVR
ncbi:MAG: hypothetical protein JMDDDDMK_01569 [Acidobacteria bacterium]|nr:hypothetical protein [Acidobacteriota bacterium]